MLHKLLNDYSTIRDVWLTEGEDNDMDCIVLYERIFTGKPKDIVTQGVLTHSIGPVTKWVRVGNNLGNCMWYCCIYPQPVIDALLDFCMEEKKQSLFQYDGKTYEWRKVSSDKTLVHLYLNKFHRSGRYYPITIEVKKKESVDNLYQYVPKAYRKKKKGTKCNDIIQLNARIIY
jgi:hypothetical protein